MRSLYVSAAGLALVVASSFAVQAADLYGGSYKDAPPPPPRFTWNGVYGGLNAGGGWGQSELDERSDPIFESFFLEDVVGRSASYNVNGFIGGLQAGMYRQYGNWVLGGELNLSGANIDGSSGNCNLTAPGGVAGISQSCSTTVNWVGSGVFKLGYAWNRWLTYGTVGWAIAGIDHKATFRSEDFGDFQGAENETADGIAYGGGIEYAFTDDMSFGVEYTRMNLRAEGSGLQTSYISTGSRDVDLNVVRAKLNFKLGPGSKLW